MSLIVKSFRDLTLRAVDVDYPLVVHVPMSLISMCDYRQWREGSEEPHSWLYDLLCSSFTHSMGGGVGMMSLIEGKNPLYYFYTDADYVHVQVFAYLAGYWSPFDVTYRTLTQARHPLRLSCVAAGAFDSITTMLGLVDKCRSQFPENKLLPVIASVVLFKSGEVFQSMVAGSQGKAVRTVLTHPDSTFSRSAILALAYWYFGYGFKGGRHRDRVVVIITALYCVVELLEDILEFDAFARVHAPLRPLLLSCRQVLRLGPQPKSGGDALKVYGDL